MSPAWQVVLGVLGILGTLGGSFLVARYAGKASTHATDTSAVLQKESNAVDGFHQLVADLQQEMTRLRKDHDELKVDHAELKASFRVMEQERVKDKTLIRHLIAYIRILIDALKAANLPIPEGPGGIDLEGGPLSPE